jgi:hypothetical protein
MISEDRFATLREAYQHHPPSSVEVEAAHGTVRALFETVAVRLAAMLPDHPASYRALEKLDEACMATNAAIARTQLQ